MFRRRKKSEVDRNDRELDESFSQVDEEDDSYEDGDFDDLQEEYDEQEKAVLTSEKKKEYYVKSEDLINEIRKYQESKKSSPDGKGKISEELRTDDNEDLYKVLNASKVLPGTAIEMNS